jgi:transposase
MEKKSKKRQRKYDAQFKQEALRQIENGQSVASVAQALGVSEALLYQWRQRSRHSNSGQSGEVEALRKQIKQLETERDILKKALTIFGRQS